MMRLRIDTTEARADVAVALEVQVVEVERGVERHAGRDAERDVQAPTGLAADRAPGAPPVVIGIEHVSKWYGDFKVLDDCSTHVARGEVVVVCGPSGSGKSTLIKTVNALESIQQGRVVVDGVDTSARGTDLSRLRARVGMVFQHFELFPHLSVIDNLTLAQTRVLGRRPEEARERGVGYLARVGLQAQRDKRPAQLSGGAAAARRDRTRVVDGSAGDAVRRADLGAGSGNGRRGARCHGRPCAGRHDDDVRDPRNGIRAQGLGPRRLHGSRAHPGGCRQRILLRRHRRTHAART